MPKSQIIEPAKERKAGTIPFAEIPLNQYKQDIAKEKEAYGAEALVGMYEDMLLIRVFENMLQTIKTQGSYEGIEYDHKNDEYRTFRVNSFFSYIPVVSKELGHKKTGAHKGSGKHAKRLFKTRVLKTQGRALTLCTYKLRVSFHTALCDIDAAELFLF